LYKTGSAPIKDTAAEQEYQSLYDTAPGMSPDAAREWIQKLATPEYEQLLGATRCHSLRKRIFDYNSGAILG